MTFGKAVALMLEQSTMAARAAPPRVSVVIPAYRASRFIGRAVSSVIAQTWRDFEVIVVDDGSPDGAELRVQLATFDERVRYVRRANGGPSAARNTGILAARGELVAFLDADDEWTSTFLADQCGRLDWPDAPDLVYSDALVSGASAPPRSTFTNLCPSTGEADFHGLILGTCVVLTSSVVVRRQLVVKAGLFDESMRRAEDFELWLRLARRGARIVYQDRPLVRRHLEPGGLSEDLHAMLASALRVLDVAEADPELDERDRALIAVRRVELESHLALHDGKLALSRGDTDTARAQFERAVAFFNATEPRRARKLRATLMGLRIWPRAIAYALEFRRRARVLRRPVSMPTAPG